MFSAGRTPVFAPYSCPQVWGRGSRDGASEKIVMEKTKKIFTSLWLGLILAFVCKYLFQALFDIPFLDQILLISISTAAFGFMIYSLLEARESKKRFLPDLQGRKKWLNGAMIKSFLKQNAPGMLIVLFFLIVYLYIGSFFNTPLTAMRDNYLDADNEDWVLRIADPSGYRMDMRAPHPFAFFLFRPIGWITNLFFQDPYRSATFLNAFAGSLCVFLVWFFVKIQSRNRIQAFLVAALIGLCTSHLVFSSIVETYIFSAFLLISFYLLLLRDESIGKLITISLLSFGLTITNFVQTLIGFVISRPQWKKIVRFAGMVLSLGIIFTLIHTVWYPTSRPFFLISSIKGENTFAFSIFQEPSWNIIGRGILLIRTMLLYSVIAPLPFVSGEAVPSFQFFEWANLHDTYLYSEYNGLGNILVVAWAVLLLFASLTFLWEFMRTRKINLSFAFVGCLLFNFVLHYIYGEDPILYSPNWTFALIFFVSAGLGPLVKNRIFQAGFSVFVLLLAYNQWQFIKFLMDTVSSYLD